MAIRNSRGQAGFTLIELLIAIAIIGLLAAIAIPHYQTSLYKRDIEQAKTDILRLQQQITRIYIAQNEFPNSLEEVLEEIGEPELLDPWGTGYEYNLLIGQQGNGGARKDKKLNPVNSDYDLYSKGRDKRSTQAFTANHAKDDIVRANNGRFIGLADDY